MEEDDRKLLLTCAPLSLLTDIVPLLSLEAMGEDVEPLRDIYVCI